MYVQVAERALFLWNNDHIVRLMSEYRQVVLPVIFEALEKNVRSHWNQAIHGLTTNVQRMFHEMDPELFEECQKEYYEKESRAAELEEKRKLTWQRLEMVAAKGGGDDMVMVN